VVFFCQNNGWAISAPFSTQSRIPAADRASGFGFPGVRVDGNDVVATHAVTTEALDRARQGGGPTLIEAVTYRRNPHTTADDDLRYRSSAENQHWSQRDPIDRVRTHLLSETADGARIDDAFLADLEEECERLGARLRSGVRKIPNPGPGEPFCNTFTDMTPHLARQMQSHLAFVAAGEETTS